MAPSQPFQPSPEQLLGHVKGLETRIRDHIRRLEVLTIDMEGFETEGYEHFKTKVLPKELDAIAHQLAAVDPENVVQISRLLGQYKEVGNLMDLKDQISTTVNSLHSQLDKDDKELQRVRNEIAKRAETAS